MCVCVWQGAFDITPGDTESMRRFSASLPIETMLSSPQRDQHLDNSDDRAAAAAAVTSPSRASRGGTSLSFPLTAGGCDAAGREAANGGSSGAGAVAVPHFGETSNYFERYASPNR